MSNIVIIRVRGGLNITYEVKDTLQMLYLGKKNNCVVREDSPSLRGMLQKAKDFITWGEISDENFKELQKKEGKPYRLNSPTKGYGKSIKLPFSKGGALGDRKEKINDLLKRML